MCSKPISARAGKGGGVCSGPHTISKQQLYIPTGQAVPSTFAQACHTVLLFAASAQDAQVCCACNPQRVQELMQPEGLHRARLRQVFARGRVESYEWQADNRVHRTTLLPLPDKEGTVEEVLSITQDISAWSAAPQRGVHTLHDGTPPKTFAQILLAARESEKREVAKALHDEIGTASVMLAALVSLTKQSIKKGDNRQALKDLERLQTQSQQSIERLRNIIVTLRPPSLDTDGALRGSMEELIKEVCSLGRITYRFECAKQMSEKGISDRVKILLYRLVQEALSNVVKHAHATRVTVQLKRVKDEMLVCVSDDGVGFKNVKCRSIHHVGLRSMQDSVLLLGGTLKISSTPGKGTTIQAVCPCVVYEENE